MHTLTFSLHHCEPRRCFVDTAQETYHALCNMSTQTKARLELIALLVALALTLASAAKVFVFLPHRVDAVEKEAAIQAARIEVLQVKGSATDVAIAGILPQLTEIRSGISRIEQEVRDQRNKP